MQRSMAAVLPEFCALTDDVSATNTIPTAVAPRILPAALIVSSIVHQWNPHRPKSAPMVQEGRVQDWIVQDWLALQPVDSRSNYMIKVANNI